MRKLHFTILPIAMAVLFLISTLLSTTPVTFAAPVHTSTAPVTTAAQYNISVEFDSETKTLSGSEIVTYTNNSEDDLKTLCLHLYPDSYNQKESKPSIGLNTEDKLKPEEIGDIDVSNVQVNSSPVSYTESKQLLKITLDKPLAKNETVNISMDFIVKIPKGTDRLGYVDDIYSITNWYPIMSIYNQNTHKWDENEFHTIGESNYSEVADYAVTIKTPREMTIAATGTITCINWNGNEKTTRIAADKSRDFVFIMSKRYKAMSTIWNGIKVTSYYIADKGTTGSVKIAKNLLDVVVDSMKFYSEVYGKYPYQELKIVETYLSGGAMEYPQLIQMGEYTELDKESVQEHSSWLEDAAAHETGHQWWYAIVGNNEFAEPMMDESINTFSTAYYFEKRYGKSNQNSQTLRIRQRISEYSTRPINTSVDKFSSWSDYQRIIYGRGAELFQDIYMRIGEEKLIRAMRIYYDKYKFKIGSITAFADILEEVGGQEIKAHFFNAINNKNYFPANIALNATELRKVKNDEELRELKKREASNGISISSILLRGLLGNKITFVIPSKASATVTKAASAYAEKTKKALSDAYDVEVAIVKDTSITEKQKSSNLILLGNTESNTLMNQFKSQLPLKVTSTTAYVGKTQTTANNLSAIYAIKNPRNSNNIMLVVYWKNNLKFYDLLDDNYDQYILNSSNEDELRGKLQ